MYNNFQKLLFLFQDLSVLFIDEWKNKDTKNSWTEIKDKLKIQLSFKSSPIFNIFPFKFISIKIYVYTTWQLIFQNIEKSSIFFFFSNDIGTTSLLLNFLHPIPFQDTMLVIQQSVNLRQGFVLRCQ